MQNWCTMLTPWCLGALSTMGFGCFSMLDNIVRHTQCKHVHGQSLEVWLFTTYLCTIIIQNTIWLSENHLSVLFLSCATRDSRALCTAHTLHNIKLITISCCDHSLCAIWLNPKPWHVIYHIMCYQYTSTTTAKAITSTNAHIRTCSIHTYVCTYIANYIVPAIIIMERIHWSHPSLPLRTFLLQVHSLGISES